MTSLSEGLGRQIAFSMVAATLGSLLVAIVSIYLFYGLVVRLAPDVVPVSTAWFPNRVEWLLIVALCMMGASLAVAASIRLAARIVEPLTSVAATARLISAGDLSARVAQVDRSSGEAAQLVDDFNAMATGLQAASEDISRWNAVIAHELRTPVTILRGRLQGLAEGVFNPEEALFRSLLRQVDGLARLVEDVRTLSLFESGHLDCRFEMVRVVGEIADVVELMEPDLFAAGFGVRTSFEEGEAEIDAPRLRQALIALLENARRHATPGMLSVVLDVETDRVVLRGVDQGPGLSAEFAERAFRPFERSIASETTSVGSGLGLSVVKAVAQAHGGTAGHSTVGGGSCFAIEVPRWQPRFEGTAGRNARPPVSDRDRAPSISIFDGKGASTATDRSST